jgi:hypothetical protein
MSVMRQLQIEGGQNCLNGSLMFREVACSGNIPEGMKPLLIAGLVLVPEDFVIPTDSKVRAKGFRLKGFSERTGVVIFTDPEPEPLDRKYWGWEVAAILKEPIWKF